MRKFMLVVAVMAVSFGIALGKEVRAKIVKVDERNITIQVFDKDTKSFSDPKEYRVSKDVKVFERKKDEITKIEGGLTADIFKQVGKDGIPAILKIENDRVLEIIIVPPKKK